MGYSKNQCLFRVRKARESSCVRFRTARERSAGQDSAKRIVHRGAHLGHRGEGRWSRAPAARIGITDPPTPPEQTLGGEGYKMHGRLHICDPLGRRDERLGRTGAQDVEERAVGRARQSMC